MFASGNALPTLISAVSPDTIICPTLSSLGAVVYLFFDFLYDDSIRVHDRVA